ncbi:MAG: branched-chain amino acid aminotransferase [Muribaculaceae bacterium]|nr:branched-chain amino acid aminotransferase [Muribaculaceae bacterium]
MSNAENIDWGNLSFSYMKTDYNVRCTFKDGKWGEIEVSQDETINLHMAATCLHYGQEAFEGQKAFVGQDGKVRLFRIRENAKRIANSARGILMEPIPEELFVEMCTKVVQLNKRFIPPYGCGASFYLRPLEIGITPRVGVRPADEYMFIIFAMPVGPYFKGGFQPTKVAIYREYDRAAPLGTGCWKVGGNYAAGMAATAKAKANGYSAALFLDPKEKKYLDECGPANFFAIKDNTYITPKSGSILPSITNMSLQQIAADMGLKVECRPIPVEELATFEEAAECGTAAVASPIQEIYDEANDKTYYFAPDGKPGPVTTELYRRLRGIQCGDIADEHGWTMIVE